MCTDAIAIGGHRTWVWLGLALGFVGRFGVETTPPRTSMKSSAKTRPLQDRSYYVPLQIATFLCIYAAKNVSPCFMPRAQLET